MTGRLIITAFLASLLAACATPAARTADPAAAPVPGNVYTGEVWNWDERAGVITLNRHGELIRVKAAPDQFIGLQLHQRATIRGELAPPAEVEVVTVPVGPVTPVPRGAADRTELTGTVSTVTSEGRLTVHSPRGALELMAAAGADQRYRPGDAVRVRIDVQPVDLQPLPAGSTPPTPSPPLQDAPGDYAVVTGRVLAVEPAGVLTVESPTGPIRVVVPPGDRYRAEEHVEVRTAVQPGR